MSIKAILGIVAAAFLVLAPLTPAFAAPNVWNPGILNGPLVTCTGDGTPPTAPGAKQLPPCRSVCDFILTAINIIYFGIGVVIWILTPLMFTIGGIMYLLAGGKPEMMGTATKMLTGTVVGVLIVLCGWLFISLILTFLQVKSVGGFGADICPATAATP